MLINKLKKFVKNPNKVDTIKTSIREIRPLYRAKKKMRGIVFYIFNSMFNRTPNLEILKVRKSCLTYVFRIGSGIASYNDIPLSWITNTVIGSIKNFVLKDRGHIFETVISLYNHKWNLKEVIKYCEIELNVLQGNKKKTITKKQDESRYIGIKVLSEVLEFLKQEKVILKQNGVLVSNQTVSIETICDNITDFDKHINDQVVSLNIRKESIWAHCREMLNLNNKENKWIDYLKAFLNFNQYVMEKSKSDTWLKDELKIETLQTELDQSDIWTLKDGKNAPILLSKGIKSFKDKIEEFADVIPFQLLGNTYYEEDFTKTGGGDYFHRTDDSILTALKSIYDGNATYEEAHKRINIFESIIKQNSFWMEFYDRKDFLFDQYKNTQYDTVNLEHCTIESESFGMACARACYDLIMKTCDDRSSDMLIRNTVMKFTEKLTEVLEEVCEDKTLFVESSMEKRFDRVILPAYLSILNDKSTTLSKTELRKIHLGELDSVFFGDVKETKFKYINPLIEKYNNPKIKEMDFDKVVNNAKESNIDLGQKIQTDGYTLDNTFLQIKGHNRSSSDGNHTIDNVEYWIWLAEENQKLVNHHEEYLVKNKMFDVIVDAEKLTKIFK